MDDGGDRVGRARELHQAGRFAEAEALYRGLLAESPQDRDVQYLLGTVLLQTRRFEEAAGLLAEVVADRPGLADAHNNLGVAHKALGRWEEAARAFQAAVSADPDYAQAVHNLGVLMEDRGLHVDAEKCFRHVLRLAPDDLPSRLRLGHALRMQEKFAEAETCYRAVLEQHPDDVETRVHLGFVLARQEKLDEATDEYRRVLATVPTYHQVHNNLSWVLERQGRLEESAAEAARSIEIFPRFPEGFNNLGIALRALHRPDEAVAAFGQALRLRSGFALAEFNLGTTHLLAGRWLEGWPGYERRLELGEGALPAVAAPLWNGRPLPDGRLLVRCEQGFGDALLFARYLPLVKDRVKGTLRLECPTELRRLFAGRLGIDEIVDEGAGHADVAAHVALGSLPALFGSTPETVPRDVPYLAPPERPGPALAAALDVLDPNKPKIGFVWRGNPAQARDGVRSCPFASFAPLLAVPGIVPVALQVDVPGREEDDRTALPTGTVDLARHLTDFAETAAVLARLDLLVTVDTAACHLAGALGRPVWTLLCHTPDWRWLLERTDSPWYPTMRLFRQQTWGDWPGVVTEVRAALGEFVANRKQAG